MKAIGKAVQFSHRTFNIFTKKNNHERRFKRKT